MAKYFNLNDLQQQLRRIRQMGAWDTYRQLPGLSEMIPKEEPELALNRIDRILDAMTEEERRNPDLISSERASPIAENSAAQPREVEEFLAQFRQLRASLRETVTLSIWERIKWVMRLGKDS